MKRKVIQHGVPIAMQLGATAMLGPEAGVAARMGGAGLGSLLGSLFTVTVHADSLRTARLRQHRLPVPGESVPGEYPGIGRK